jgi:asparagine synthase (glutamine-hydrolysing)
MSDAIAHRGPDDEGFYLNGPIGLGIRRLSIIDLDGGHQPISNEDGSIWIIFNGEIYNYQSLSEELEKSGHRFKTRTDTEVIVHLYEDLGERCLEKLNGMFAFALWDERHQKLFIARDRLGQKPLFYAQSNGSFLFGSEIKSLLATGELKREIDLEAMHHYLSLRFIPPPHTMLCDIRKLPPAHYLIYREGKVIVSRYWDIDFRGKLDLSEKDLIEELAEKLDETVRLHMIADVPVGAFLSGGMDSSMIVATMSEQTTQRFKTFAIGVTQQSFNELPFARLVAGKYCTDHVEETVEADLIKSLPRMIWHLDEPSDPIAACMYHAARLASRYVKVVLGGDGGDELFAGFDRYLGIGLLEHYSLVPSIVRQKIIGPFLDVIPENFGYKSLTQKLRWTHQLSSLPNSAERYAEATCFFRFSHEDKRLLYRDALWRQVKHLNSSQIIVDQYDKAHANDPLDRMLYADFMTRLPEHSLMLTDRMTMAHSLEARSPYLDHTLVEYLAAFPGDLKIRGRELKYVLRKVAEKSLPESITRRPKQGFMFPVAYWFKDELYAFTKKFLLNSFFIKEAIFDEETVVTLLESHRRNKVDNHVRIWMLLNLGIWHMLYMQQLGVEEVEMKVQEYLHEPSFS